MEQRPRLIVPENMRWRGSVMVTDPKADAVLIRRRRRESAQTIFVLDPFAKVTNRIHEHRFNPMTMLHPDDNQ